VIVMSKAKYWKLLGGRYGGITTRGKRFIVDSLAKAKAKLGKSTRRTRRKSNPGRKRGVRRMARKKRRRGGKSMTRTAFKLIRMGALAAPAIGRIAQFGMTKEALDNIIRAYTGYSPWTKQWEPHYLLEGYGAYLGAGLATYGIPKIISILRRL